MKKYIFTILLLLFVSFIVYAVITKQFFVINNLASNQIKKEKTVEKKMGGIKKDFNKITNNPSLENTVNINLVAIKTIVS